MNSCESCCIKPDSDLCLRPKIFLNEYILIYFDFVFNTVSHIDKKLKVIGVFSFIIFFLDINLFINNGQ